MPLKQLLNSSWDIICSGARYFFFAPECLECHTLLNQTEKNFCQGCLTLFELLDPHLRCRFCFKEIEEATSTVCQECMEQRQLFTKLASACAYQGPPATMVRLMKYGNRPDLAEAAAAYMALQWMDLGWPEPDWIIPVPSTWLRRYDRGYNQAELIARALGRFLDVPVSGCLKRRLGDHSQASLDREARLRQPLNSFYLHRSAQLEDKRVLLIDDVLTTGRTLNACAEIVQSQFPFEIYGFTFCRAEEEKRNPIQQSSSRASNNSQPSEEAHSRY